MEFTYSSYQNMLEKLASNGYIFCGYEDCFDYNKSVILRHDVDYSLVKAVELSNLECSIVGEKSTYFLLLSSDFYNVFSKESREYIDILIKNGATIGLHYDCAAYDTNDINSLKTSIRRECNLLSDAIGKEVSIFSFHRPLGEVLEADIKIEGLINSYDKLYFEQMKYVSDSRRFWRENIDEYIDEGSFNRLHILTHSVWYGINSESLHDTLLGICQQATVDCYKHLNNNFRDLSEVLSINEICTNRMR